jgi:hypothetical protein
MKMPGTYLIVYDNHFAVIGKGKYVCGKLNDGKVMGVRHKDLPSMARVTECYLVTGKVNKTPEPLLVDTEARSAKRKALKIAERIGADVEVEYGTTFWVHPPEGLYESEEDDPYNGGHAHASWSEALDAIQQYALDKDTRGGV